MITRDIKEIQISRHITIYGQTLGVFKRENNKKNIVTEKTKSCIKSKM